MESPPFFKHIFKNVQGEVQPVPGVQARLLCFRVSQAVIVVLARAVVSWESSAGEGSASRMTQVAGRILVLVAVARRLSFLAGFFRRPPSAPRGCSQCSDTWAPPPPPTGQLASAEPAREGESLQLDRRHSLRLIIMDTVSAKSYHLCHSLSVQSQVPKGRKL